MTGDPATDGTAGQPAPAAAESASSIGHRLRRHVQEYGLRSTVSRVLYGVRLWLFLDETHVWYELTPGTDRPRVELPEGFIFRQADAELLPSIGHLQTVSPAEARRRVSAGNDLWFVLDGDRAAFACWTFNRTMPMLSAPGGQLALQPGTVCLEVSVTAPDYRGRQLAPAAWTLLADEMARRGVGSIITRVDVRNTASRKAVVKAGFREFGRMRFRQIAGVRRTTVPEAFGSHGDYLRRALA